MIDRRLLEGKIIEILVRTQYRFFVEKNFPEQPTATDFKTSEKEAMEHYLGIPKNGEIGISSPESAKFHNIISLQSQCILREIEIAEASHD